MGYNLKWLTYADADMIQSLSNQVYNTDKSAYQTSLNTNRSDIFNIFLTPSNVINANQRRILGVFDHNGQLVQVTGVRQLKSSPAWVLSLTLSNLRNYTFVKIWKMQLQFLCSYFEHMNYNEFYVTNPATLEETYRYVTKFMRQRYWTFVEATVPATTKAEFSLHYNILGYQSYSHDMNIRRYILKRDNND